MKTDSPMMFILVNFGKDNYTFYKYEFNTRLKSLYTAYLITARKSHCNKLKSPREWIDDVKNENGLMSFTEIGLRLNISKFTARTRYLRGIVKLRELILNNPKYELLRIYFN